MVLSLSILYFLLAELVNTRYIRQYYTSKLHVTLDTYHSLALMYSIARCY